MSGMRERVRRSNNFTPTKTEIKQPMSAKKILIYTLMECDLHATKVTHTTRGPQLSAIM